MQSSLAYRLHHPASKHHHSRVYLHKSPACWIGMTLLNIGSLKVDPEPPRTLACKSPAPPTFKSPLSLHSHSQQKYIKRPSFPAIHLGEAGDDLVENLGRVPDPVISHRAHSPQQVDKTRPVGIYCKNLVKRPPRDLSTSKEKDQEPRTRSRTRTRSRSAASDLRFSICQI